MTGHTRNIKALAWSGDGKFILSAAEDKTLRLWDAQRGVEAKQNALQTDQIFSVAISADGRRLGLVGGKPGAAQLWETETGREIALKVTRGANEPWTHERLVLTPDGKRAIVSRGKKFFVLSADNGALLHEVDHPDEAIACMSISADGKSLVTGAGGGGFVRLWALEWPVSREELAKRIADLEAQAQKQKDAGRAEEAGKLLDEAAKAKEELKKLEAAPSAGAKPPAGKAPDF